MSIFSIFVYGKHPLLGAVMVVVSGLPYYSERQSLNPAEVYAENYAFQKLIYDFCVQVLFTKKIG